MESRTENLKSSTSSLFRSNTSLTRIALRPIIAVALLCLGGCATRETIPSITVLPNDSGIEAGRVESLEPGWLIGKGRDEEGRVDPPDLPSRAIIKIKRVQTLHNKEPWHFIPASGIVQVASIERYSEYPGARHLGPWRQLIQSSSPLSEEARKKFNDSDPSEIPWANAARCFHGKMAKRTFPWGDAVLFVTHYIQGKTGGPVNNDMLVLVVQGFTKDGRYAVNARFEIHHPALPDSLWDDRRKGRAVFSIDNQCDKAEDWLDSQPDASFSPSIGQYEKFLSSLEISAGSPINRKEKKPAHADHETHSD